MVGRAVRRSGSRPLLVAEIAEHWQQVMDSCLLRWSLEQGQEEEEHQVEALQEQQGQGQGRGPGRGGVAGRDALVAAVQRAYAEAQQLLLEDEAALRVRVGVGVGRTLVTCSGMHAVVVRTCTRGFGVGVRREGLRFLIGP